MRIAHVSDCYAPRLGGIERQVEDLGHQQVAAGHDVHVLTSVSWPDRPQSLLCEHRPTRNPRSLGRIQYLHALRGPGLARSGKFDVIHAHVSTASPLGLLSAAAAAKAGIPTVVTVHSLWTALRPLYRTLDVLMHLRSAPIVWTAVSRAAAESVQHALGADVPVAVLPNAVDGGAWKVQRRPRDPSRVRIATVGRLVARKRPRHLLRMLREARAMVPPEIGMEMTIAGDGSQRKLLERILERHDMAGWVHLIGAADHSRLRSVYADTDFYVAPATLESFGIAALEARCSGLPVVARESSGIADYIRDGVDGLLTSDDTAMATAIAGLVRSPALLAELQQHASAPARVLTWPEILARCDDLYAAADRASATGSTRH